MPANIGNRKRPKISYFPENKKNWIASLMIQFFFNTRMIGLWKFLSLHAMLAIALPVDTLPFCRCATQRYFDGETYAYGRSAQPHTLSPHVHFCPNFRSLAIATMMRLVFCL